MNPTDYTYSEVDSGGGGFGPKSPTSEFAMERADEEAAAVGNIALYCMGVGSIPRVSMRGFWRVNGVCRGMSMDGLPDVVRVCNHLRTHLGDAMRTEGIDEYLQHASDIRAISMHMFPNENTDWLTIEEAADFTGRSRATIYEWIAAGGMPVLDDRWGKMVSKEALRMKQALIMANMFRRASAAREARKLGDDEV